MATDTTSFERVRYLGLDFGTLLDDFRQGALAKFGPLFNAFQNDFGAVLLDYFAYGLDGLGYYLDRRITRCFLELARPSDALLLHARSRGYKPRSAVSATTDLLVSVLSIHTSTVIVPVGFQLQTTEGLVFEVIEETSFDPGEGAKTVPVSEGFTVSERFVATGLESQRFTLRRVPTDKTAVSGSSSVQVGSSDWLRLDFLPFDDVDVYEENFYGTAAQLLFGDGAAGNIPALNDEIRATYRVCSGFAGNVGPNTITSEVVPLTVDFKTVTLSVTNPTSAVGGDDAESANKIRALAGKVFKSRNVAVTEEDYNTQANAFANAVAGRVAEARAYITRTSGSDLTLQNELLIIEDASNDPLPTVTASSASIRASLASISASLALISTSLEEIAEDALTVDGSLSSVQAGIRSTKNRSVEASTDADDIKVLTVDAKAVISDISTAPASSALTADDRALLNGFLDNIDAEADQVKASMTTILAGSDISLASLGESRATVVGIGTDTSDADTKIGAIEVERVVIEGLVGEETTPTGIYLEVAAVETVVVDTSATVETATQNIRDHIDRFLSMDCQANLVTVPVLSRDAGGFYAAPSSLLVQSLQDHLDERRAVEQVVAVVSGAQALVRAVVRVRIGLRAQSAESVAKVAVESAINAVLRGREFGVPLYVQELYRVVEVVEGVEFANVIIEGALDRDDNTDTTKLDDEGNLVILDSEVVTRGSVTVAAEFVQRKGA